MSCVCCVCLNEFMTHLQALAVRISASRITLQDQMALIPLRTNRPPPHWLHTDTNKDPRP